MASGPHNAMVRNAWTTAAARMEARSFPQPSETSFQA